MRHSLALILALLIAGCGLFPSHNNDESESWSVDRLYKEAKAELEEENYEKATEYFEKLEARFPYGTYAQQAQIELIYVYFKNADAASSIAAADRFIKYHPNSPAVDYAYYMKGLANFIGDKGVITSMVVKDESQRDPKSETESFDAFKALVTRFPDSKYAPDARKRMQYLANQLAMHEIHVAEFYYGRGAYVAAINRAQKVITEYPKTPATENALVLMARSYDKLGLQKLRDDATRVLDKTYPEWKTKTVTVKEKSPWWEFWKK